VYNFKGNKLCLKIDLEFYCLQICELLFLYCFINLISFFFNHLQGFVIDQILLLCKAMLVVLYFIVFGNLIEITEVKIVIVLMYMLST